MGKGRDSKMGNFSKKKGMEDHFWLVLKLDWDWDLKRKCKIKFLSIVGFSLKSMTLGKGIRLATILYTCQKGREWDCFIFLGWEMEFEERRDGILFYKFTL